MNEEDEKGAKQSPLQKSLPCKESPPARPGWTLNTKSW